MCGGGFFKDAIVLLTGPSGAGKTLASLKFIAVGVGAGERCLAFTFDETREQVKRNAAGWNMDIHAMEAADLLQVVCDYPEVASLEDHFIRIRRAVEEFAPERVVIDTLSALERMASPRALLDFVIALGAVFRQHHITTLLTSAPAGRFTPQLTPSIAHAVDRGRDRQPHRRDDRAPLLRAWRPDRACDLGDADTRLPSRSNGAPGHRRRRWNAHRRASPRCWP
jgi:circadian clock protein KaiC